jgi:hypothetical protein
MTIRQKVVQVGATGLLAPNFDPALKGYASRYDIANTSVYGLAEFIPVAVGLWGEDETVRYVHSQMTTGQPEVVLMDDLPAARQFWTMVKEGMLVWDHLTPTVVGIAHLGAELCAVYHADSAIRTLADAVDESDTEDVTEGVKDFFEINIAKATLGPRTPVLLHAGAWPKGNNGLGSNK